MARIDELLREGLAKLPPKPSDKASQSDKKRYSEQVSQAIAAAFGDELRQRGLKEARPAPPGLLGGSGAERRMAGGIGAKKVDVTWATEESGLLLGVSVKSINFRDVKTNNFQKNLINRRGDMLIEAVTLHRRFPYAVLGGFVFLDKDAADDSTARRRSTLENAHARLRLFTGREDPAGRDEQYERMYLVLLDANPFSPSVVIHAVGDPKTVIALEYIFDDLLTLVAERNPDFYECVNGKLRKATG
ncbi:MAG TPA: hypothetical protein VK475_12165 [Pyrinomonadaceae bacterium]|nr:hypothetical protein [Pyrinomonadaceae bacterium]